MPAEYPLDLLDEASTSSRPRLDAAPDATRDALIQLRLRQGQDPWKIAHDLTWQRFCLLERVDYDPYLNPLDYSDGEDYAAARCEVRLRLALEIHAAAGLDVDNEEVHDRISEDVDGFEKTLALAADPDPDGDRDQYAAVKAVSDGIRSLSSWTTSTPRPTLTMRLRGRSRAPRRGAHRHHGSRRSTPRCTSRGDPDLDGDSDPPGVSHPPARRQTAGVVL